MVRRGCIPLPSADRQDLLRQQEIACVRQDTHRLRDDRRGHQEAYLEPPGRQPRIDRLRGRIRIHGERGRIRTPAARVAPHEAGIDDLDPDAAAREFRPPSLRERDERSEEHTSELQSLMRNSYAVFCLKKKYYTHINMNNHMN